jgi:predicted glycosyltransferase involved in capsule biosynthesis
VKLRRTDFSDIYGKELFFSRRTMLVIKPENARIDNSIDFPVYLISKINNILYFSSQDMFLSF